MIKMTKEIRFQNRNYDFVCWYEVDWIIIDLYEFWTDCFKNCKNDWDQKTKELQDAIEIAKKYPHEKLQYAKNNVEVLKNALKWDWKMKKSALAIILA